MTTAIGTLRVVQDVQLELDRFIIRIRWSQAMLQQHLASTFRELVGALPEKERVVIESFYFEGLSFQEIAEERMNVLEN